MLTLRIPPEVREVVRRACDRAGLHETGGMLFGEHVGDNDFRIAEATVARRGGIASFVRELAGGLGRLDHFFRRTRHDFRRFNYLGEWHSHPSFALSPSGTDDSTMFSIVNDPTVGARFAVSMIVKLNGTELEARAFAYFPPRDRDDEVTIVYEPRS